MLVLEYFSLHTANSKEDMAIPTFITENEMNAMRYACDYVPHALLKKHEMKCGDKYLNFVQCLGDMAIEGEGSDALTYTAKWLEQVNRGGMYFLSATIYFR